MAGTLDRSNVHVLHTDQEYDAANEELHQLLDAGVDEGHPDFSRLELLEVLVSAYDRAHIRFGEIPTSPQDAVQATLDQRGMTRADLHAVMGGKSRVSEFFSGQRALSMTQLQNLRAFLGVPADLLLPAAPSGVILIPDKDAKSPAVVRERPAGIVVRHDTGVSKREHGLRTAASGRVKHVERTVGRERTLATKPSTSGGQYRIVGPKDSAAKRTTIVNKASGKTSAKKGGRRT